jgi:hypothetical protein
MRRSIAFGLAATTALAICTIVSSAAMGVELLPQFTVETGFTGTGGKAVLETKGETKVSCAKSTLEASAASKVKGTFHLAEKECAVLGLFKCTGTGDSSGVVLMAGEWILVDGGELMLLTVTPAIHFECASTSVQVKGSLLAAITPVQTKTSKYELRVKETKAKQELSEYENENGEILVATLLSSINSGAFEETGMESAESRLTTSKETEIQPPMRRVTHSRNVLFRKVLDEEQPMRYENIGVLALLLKGQTLEGAEAGNWSITDLNGCFNKILTTDEECLVTIKLLNAAANTARYKAEVEFANATETSFLVELKNN